MVVEQAVSNAYFQALSPEIGYPVYSAFAVPESAAYPYVIITQVDANQVIISGCKKWRVNVTLDIVTGFPTPTGNVLSNTIANLIENIINPDSSIDISTPLPYSIGDTRNTLSRNLESRSDNYWIYRNIRTYQHTVCILKENI